MPYQRYVEIGRVAMINFGAEYGSLVVISDVVDQNRVSMMVVKQSSAPAAWQPAAINQHELRQGVQRAAALGSTAPYMGHGNGGITGHPAKLLDVAHLRDITQRNWADCSLGCPQQDALGCAAREIHWRWVKFRAPSGGWQHPQLTSPSLLPARLTLPLYTLQALVDFPDQIRRVVNFKRMVLTDYKVDIPRLAKKSVLKAALAEADIVAKFAASSWGQKLAKRNAKAAQSDFDRYKAATIKMKRSAVVRRTFNKLKKAAK